MLKLDTVHITHKLEDYDVLCEGNRQILLRKMLWLLSVKTRAGVLRDVAVKDLF